MGNDGLDQTMNVQADLEHCSPHMAEGLFSFIVQQIVFPHVSVNELKFGAKFRAFRTFYCHKKSKQKPGNLNAIFFNNSQTKNSDRETPPFPLILCIAVFIF